QRLRRSVGSGSCDGGDEDAAVGMELRRGEHDLRGLLDAIADLAHRGEIGGPGDHDAARRRSARSGRGAGLEMVVELRLSGCGGLRAEGGLDVDLLRAAWMYLDRRAPVEELRRRRRDLVRSGK